jgi:hypothetical protein
MPIPTAKRDRKQLSASSPRITCPFTMRGRGLGFLSVLLKRRMQESLSARIARLHVCICFSFHFSLSCAQSWSKDSIISFDPISYNPYLFHSPSSLPLFPSSSNIYGCAAKLQGQVGQHYPMPPGPSPQKFRLVVIWVVSG